MDNIKTDILRAMARAFFVSAWGDAAEEAENGPNLSGKDLMSEAPRIIDESAYVATRALMFGMEASNKKPIAEIFRTLRDATEGQGDREHTAEMFGHYAAMQAMGHGVGLDDAFGSKARDLVQVPYVEFGSHSLSRDYF